MAIRNLDLGLLKLVSGLKFYHATDVRNLPSIFNHGLMPLKHARALGLSPHTLDSRRHDFAVFPELAVCVSVGHSAPAIVSKLASSPLVILEIDSAVWFDDGEHFASPTNAATDLITGLSPIAIGDIELRESHLDFWKSRFGIFGLFADPVDVVYRSGRKYEYPRNPGLKNAEPNDPNAELLFNFTIASSNIKAIHVQHKQYIDYIDKVGFETTGVPLKESPLLFSRRSDYPKWADCFVDPQQTEDRLRRTLQL